MAVEQEQFSFHQGFVIFLYPKFPDVSFKYILAVLIMDEVKDVTFSFISSISVHGIILFCSRCKPSTVWFYLCLVLMVSKGGADPNWCITGKLSPPKYGPSLTTVGVLKWP